MKKFDEAFSSDDSDEGAINKEIARDLPYSHHVILDNEDTLGSFSSYDEAEKTIDVSWCTDLYHWYTERRTHHWSEFQRVSKIVWRYKGTIS